jgi:hypothetical protein
MRRALSGTENIGPLEQVLGSVRGVFRRRWRVLTDAYKVSAKPSCPGAGDNGYTAERWPFGGDYSGLAAAADGAFHLFWPDSRGERYELRTAQARVTR